MRLLCRIILFLSTHIFRQLRGRVKKAALAENFLGFDARQGALLVRIWGRVSRDIVCRGGLLAVVLLGQIVLVLVLLLLKTVASSVFAGGGGVLLVLILSGRAAELVVFFAVARVADRGAVRGRVMLGRGCRLWSGPRAGGLFYAGLVLLWLRVYSLFEIGHLLEQVFDNAVKFGVHLH